MKINIVRVVIAGIAVSFLCLLLGCSQQKEGTQEDSTTSGNPLLTYWDDFDFSDSLVVFNPDSGEQRLADFMDDLQRADDTVGIEAIHRMLGQAKAHPNSLAHFTGLYAKYLYDLNSPIRNEALYEPVLQFLVDSTDLDEAESFRYGKRLELLRKNKPGSAASDFRFGVAGGGESRLYDLEAPYLLVFFYEPGCPYCEDDIDRISGSPYFGKLISEEKLKILALYASGDENIWKDYQARIPNKWINGIDRKVEILGKSLYDLKASPTIYLLDSNKQVLLKDSDLREVVLYLNDKT